MKILRGLFVGAAIVGVTFLVSCKDGESPAAAIEKTTSTYETEALKLQKKIEAKGIEVKQENDAKAEELKK